MNIKNLESFIYVAELGSFTKAAEKLGYSQSTVSFQIRQLEDTVQFPLFDRIHHTIKLTPKGSEVLRLAHQIAALSAEIERVADDTQTLRGHIRIAMADSLCHWLFWDNFEPFHRQFPDISLKIIPASTEEMFRLLNQNEVDLVYTLDKHIYDSNYIIASEEPVQVHFTAASSNLLCRHKNPEIPQIVREPLILTEKGMSYRRLLEEQLASQSMEIRPFLEIGDTFLICRLVEQNMGISFLPDYVTEEAVRRGTVRRLSVPGYSMEIWAQLLYHHDKWCSPEMQFVIDYLKNRSKQKHCLPEKQEDPVRKQ